MKNIDKTATILAFLVLAFFGLAWAGNWSPLGAPQAGTSIDLVRSFGPCLFAAGGGSLFVNSGTNSAWQKTLWLSGSEERINDLVRFPDSLGTSFALTTEGLFRSSKEGRGWTKIYDGIGHDNRNVLALAQDPFQKETLYIGTANGLFVSKNQGKSWARAFAEFSGKAVRDIAADRANGEIYFAADNVLYRYHTGLDSLRKVFSASLASGNNSGSADEAETISDFEDETASATVGMKLIVTPHPLFHLALATENGVFTSNDEGETWEQLPTAGFGSAAVVDLAYSERARTLFAASRLGVFQYLAGPKRWQDVYEGLTNKNILAFAIAREGEERLIVSTKNGLFTYETGSIHEPEPGTRSEVAQLSNHERLRQLFSLEPTIRDVQKEATQYANVGNWKILRWHAGSRFRALVPRLTFSKGLDVSNNIHVDTGSTTAADFFTQGPDDRDKSTDIGFTWELGDMIWSSAQTSIDSREKLMVELRNEILSEATRLYFERRRAQFELALNPPEGELDRMSALMRLEELTANLDSLTNGFLSKQLEKLYRKHPEFAELWNAPIAEGVNV